MESHVITKVIAINPEQDVNVCNESVEIFPS